jgi:hypothetical protein
MKLYRKHHNRKAPTEQRATYDVPPSAAQSATAPKETVGPKDVQSLVDVLSRNIWCPNSTHFRRHFNDLIRFSLRHMQACGDGGYLSRLVNAIPDKKSRTLIAAILSETFPIRYLAEGKRPRFRKEPGKDVGTTWDVEHFDLFKGSNHTVTETATTLHRDSYERREALDLVLDVLTTYRNDFDLADVECLEQTLSRIKARASNSERTTD